MADPRIWGTDAWKTMHRFSLAYPQRPSIDQQRAARQFFDSMTYLLPCIGCRVHYAQYLKKTLNRKAVSSRDELVKWVYNLHEAVNHRLGKPTGVVQICDLPRLYNSFPKRYVSLDGKELLDTPRFTTVDDDYGVCDSIDNVTKPDGLDDASFRSVDLADDFQPLLPDCPQFIASNFVLISLISVLLIFVFVVVILLVRKRRAVHFVEPVRSLTTS